MSRRASPSSTDPNVWVEPVEGDTLTRLGKIIRRSGGQSKPTIDPTVMHLPPPSRHVSPDQLTIED